MKPESPSAVVPDLVDAIQGGGVTMDVAFGDVNVHSGATIPPEEVRCSTSCYIFPLSWTPSTQLSPPHVQASFAPRVTMHGLDPSSRYTLICSDPDPPDPANPIYKEWLHWLVVNIPGKEEASAKDGDEVTPYMYVCTMRQRTVRLHSLCAHLSL